jgi:hypothetical protein
MTTTTNPAQGTQVVATGKVWQAGLMAAILAAIANLIVFFVSSQLLSSPLLIPAQPGSTDLAPLTAIPVVAATVIPIIGATILLALLGRWVARPFTVFTIIAVLFLLLSFGGPLTLPVDGVTKLVLNLMHIVAGGVAIGILTTRARAG